MKCEFLMLLIAENKQLRELVVEGCNLNNVFLEFLIQTCHNLSSLNLKFGYFHFSFQKYVDLINNCPNLNLINICDMDNDTELDCAFEFNRLNQSVKLFHHSIVYETEQTIFDQETFFLSKINIQIKHLTLSYYRFSDCISFCEIIAKYCPFLESFELFQWKKLTNLNGINLLFINCHNLHTLTINDCIITKPNVSHSYYFIF
jgi:hypothetical protein